MPPLVEDPDDAIDHQKNIAGSSQGLFTNTALTTPEGHGEASVRAGREGFISTVAYGATAGTELWVDFGRIDLAGEEGLQTLAGGIKQVLTRSDTTSVAWTGSIRSFDASEGMSVNVMSTSFVLSSCSADCSLLFSGGFGVMLGGEIIVPTGTIGASIGNDWFRVQAEGVAIAGGGTIGFLGARLAGKHFSVDAGAMYFPVDNEESADTHRWVPFGGLAMRI